MNQPRIGLALGSGSARGWAHIGVIAALREAGVEPQVVAGSSFGALVGAAHVSGRLDPLRAFAEQLTWSEVIRMLDLDLSGGGLVGGRLIIEALGSFGVAGAVEDCKTSFAAVATDIDTGREIWLRSGPILDAVRASISIPGFMSPTRREGRWLADGALVNPVPVSVCRALGADIIIAVNLNNDSLTPVVRPRPASAPQGARTPAPDLLGRIAEQIPAQVREQAASFIGDLFPPPEPSPGYFEVLLNSIEIMQDQITRSRLAGEPPHILLTPRLHDIGPMEYHRAEEAIAEGFACAQQALPALQKYL